MNSSVESGSEAIRCDDIYWYELPEERIAQRPVYPYDSAKLLVVDRKTNALLEKTFTDFADLIRPHDLVVFNNTKVIPARFFGKFCDGERAVEVVVLKEESPKVWLCVGKPLKRFTEGAKIAFDGGLFAEVIERRGFTHVLVRFFNFSEKNTADLMEEVGVMPIPPYIRGGRGDSEDTKDYQTIFASQKGSIAAPTASLHFTEPLIEKIKAKGAAVRFLTLHVGAASFLPLWHEQDKVVTPPGAESFVYDKALMDEVRKTRSNGGRVIAVGTTSVRALESMALQEEEGKISQETELFITPGFSFKAVDAVVTNFHQPRTTHLLLVQALLGRPLLEQSYQFALAHDFRFLSYGDGMFITD